MKYSNELFRIHLQDVFDKQCLSGSCLSIGPFTSFFLFFFLMNRLEWENGKDRLTLNESPVELWNLDFCFTMLMLLYIQLVVVLVIVVVKFRVTRSLINL